MTNRMLFLIGLVLVQGCLEIPNWISYIPSPRPNLFVNQSVGDFTNQGRNQIVNRDDIRVEYSIIDSKYIMFNVELNAFGW